MNLHNQPVKSEPFSISPSTRLLHIELVMHGLLMLAILNLIEWPYNLLFLMLVIGMGWQFFHKYYIQDRYAGRVQIQWCSNPPGIRWTEAGCETTYPVAQVKILMTRWFILLQLGKGRKRVSRLLLSDSFDNSDSYSKCRKLMLQVVCYVS